MSKYKVALLAEGVGRNPCARPPSPTTQVALLAEGVGRNSMNAGRRRPQALSPSSRRAWVEIYTPGALSGRLGSPSSRRAWVEIISTRGLALSTAVALLAEGVGRNLTLAQVSQEMQIVALLAEGVGRNPSLPPGDTEISCRPPRGGRG